MWFLTFLLLLSCPADTLDDRRDVLFDAIAGYADPLGLSWDSTEVRVAWVDLNGDQRDDALVALSGQAWCGSGGCTVLVFEAMHGVDAEEFGAYRPAAEIRLVNGPVHVVDTDRIWSDLVARADDGTLRRLRFDGESYPPSPGSAPRGRAPAGATVLFADTN